MQEIPADFSPLSLDPFPTAWPHVYVARQKQDTYHRRSKNDDQDDCKKSKTGAKPKAKSTKATTTKPTKKNATVAKPTAKESKTASKKVDKGLFALVARK